ncbi:MAG: CehA/McbA family metallohydrolase [Bacteroidales bacterium]|nr:CehA/McbA family metallohydrolase [Bacteroidales bacterium]
MNRVSVSLAFVLLLLACRIEAQPVLDGYKVYYGDLHNHCNVSDGQGTVDAAYNYAKNTSQLDFFGLSDHANLMSQSEWTLIKNTANAYNEDSVFAAFYGFEWTTYFSYGHVTVVNTDDFCSSGSPTNTFVGLMNWLGTRNGIAFFNHPGWDALAFNEFDHFADPPSDKFVGIELFNDQDGFSKYYYNNGYYNNDGNKGYYDEALIRDWKIGAAGGDDNHTANWGNKTPWRVGVLATALTRTDIFSAFQARRFFSTMDKNLVVSININGFDMGSTIQGGNWNAVVEAFDGDNELITDIKLMKNGSLLLTWDQDDTHPIASFPVACADGDYFYAIVHEADGNEAISSPVFISGIAQPPLITLTAPTNGAIFPSGSNISMAATASDSDGSITWVKFYLDDVLIGQDSLAPYTYSWNNASTGTYSIYARAFDFTGLVTGSDTIVVTIDPPPTLSVTPESRQVSYEPGTTTYEVSSNIGWVVSSDQTWCSVTPAGSGNALIEVSYSENLSPSPRTAIITIDGPGLPPVNVTVNQDGVPSRMLNLGLLLQGLYLEAGQMRPASDASGNPFFGQGIADKIIVELHETGDYSSIVYSSEPSNLLIDGSAVVLIPEIYGGNYFVTVKHRNSITVVSAQPLSFAVSAVELDFRLEGTAFMDNMQVLPEGERLMFAGDINQDGVVDMNDVNLIEYEAGIFLSGYRPTDINGDGCIDSSDLIRVDNNARSNVSAVFP